MVVSKYRPKSSQSINPTRHSRILPPPTSRGVRSTKASALRDLSAASRSRNVCSSATWGKEERLCDIRSDYTGDTLCYSRKPMINSKKPSQKSSIETHTQIATNAEVQTSMDAHILLQRRKKGVRNAWISDNGSENLGTSDVEIASRKFGVTSQGTITESTSLSLDKWHGAEWQCKLPKMYLPRNFKRDCNNSVVVRSKSRKSRWRTAEEMPGAGESV